MIYILWNNGYPQVGMGYWLKSFNADPPPVPGKSYTVADINNCESIQSDMASESNVIKYHWSRLVSLSSCALFGVCSLMVPVGDHAGPLSISVPLSRYVLSIRMPRLIQR